MGSIVKSDIFFFVTTIAVVLLSSLLVIALIYFIRILRDALFVSRKVKEEGEKIIEDVDSLRKSAKKESFKAIRVFTSFVKNFKIKTKSKN